MTNAIEIVKEFKEAGDEAKLLFDGAGVTWPGKLVKDDHPMHDAFEEVKDNVLGACSFCSDAFEATEKVKKADIPLLEDYDGHPSIRTIVKDGFQIITV